MSEAGDPRTVPVLIGHDWNVEPSEQPRDRNTLQQYEVPRDVIQRWRESISPYLRARAGLIRVIEKQGWRLPGHRPEGTYVDIVFDGPPDAEPPRFVDVEDQDGRSIRAGEWIDRGDGMWALRIAR